MISQKSASILNLTHVVYDIARNCVFFYGNMIDCLELCFTSDNYMTMPIGYLNESA